MMISVFAIPCLNAALLQLHERAISLGEIAVINIAPH
jgi:hypothetical protein